MTIAQRVKIAVDQIPGHQRAGIEVRSDHEDRLHPAIALPPPVGKADHDRDHCGHAIDARQAIARLMSNSVRSSKLVAPLETTQRSALAWSIMVVTIRPKPR